MDKLNAETASAVKAAIFDMESVALKQVLFGMVNILKEHPSILAKAFLELVFDGRKYNAVNMGGLK